MSDANAAGSRPAAPAVPAAKQYRRGGKAGRRSRVPRLLRDFRRAWKNPDAEGGSPGERVLRRLLREHPDVFLAQFREAERAHAEVELKRPEAGRPAPAVSDPKRFAGIKERARKLAAELTYKKWYTTREFPAEDLAWLVAEVDRLVTVPTGGS